MLKADVIKSIEQINEQLSNIDRIDTNRLKFTELKRQALMIESHYIDSINEKIRKLEKDKEDIHNLHFKELWDYSQNKNIILGKIK